MAATDEHPPWTNWAANETCRPQEIAYPRTEEEVSEIIASATRRGLPIRVVGAGHSFSTICLTNGVLISMDRMRGIMQADPGTGLVRARAGTRIRDFGDDLWAAGLCLKNQGDIDSQHIVGAMSTATHGSGIRQQCFSATARRFRVIMPSGEAAEVTEDDPELLAAMQVSLGLLGVITEVEFQAREAFAIAERIEFWPLEEILARWDEEMSNRRHFSFFWMPSADSPDRLFMAYPDGQDMTDWARVNRDFRSKVATGGISVDDPVHLIMSAPVNAVPSTMTLATAFVQMVKSGVHHLVVQDEHAVPIGVLRAMDLASVEVRDPMLIRTAIDAAADVGELIQACLLLPPTVVELHDTGVPAEHIGALLAALTDAVLSRLLMLSSDDSPLPDRSWLVLGSMARQEPLPGSDVDTGIVWADNRGAELGEHIRRAAASVLDDMEKCGLRRCLDGANADNPLFSRSRSAWTAAARAWITEPTREGALLLSSIAADSRPITELTIGRAVTDTIRQTTRSTEFLDALLGFTLTARPPVGFIRDFVVDHTGEHRGGLDLKRGGLRPISALARWLAIATGEVRGSTPERLGRAAAAGLLTKDEAETLAGAFKDVYELLLRQEVAAIRDGRPPSNWIAPRDLDLLTRRHLRDSFRAISTVQAQLAGAWKTRLTRA